MLLSIALNIYQATGKTNDPSLDAPPETTTTPPETTLPAEPPLTKVEITMVSNVISKTFASIRAQEIPRSAFMTESSYQQVCDLANNWFGGAFTQDGSVYKFYFSHLTEEMEETFRKIFTDAECFVLVDMSKTTPTG